MLGLIHIQSANLFHRFAHMKTDIPIVSCAPGQGPAVRLGRGPHRVLNPDCRAREFDSPRRRHRWLTQRERGEPRSVRSPSASPAPLAAATAKATGVGQDRAGRLICGKNRSLPGHPEIFLSRGSQRPSRAGQAAGTGQEDTWSSMLPWRSRLPCPGGQLADAASSAHPGAARSGGPTG
jgi:hypothetical protein